MCDQPKKTQSKGRRELRNLEWEMNDGKVSVDLERTTRSGRGKGVVIP